MEIVGHHLRPELDIRLRFIVQEAWKFCRRGKRTILSGDDIHEAFRLTSGEWTGKTLQQEEVYGISTSKTLLRVGAAGFGE